MTSYLLELIDARDGLEEQLHDTIAQHRSEVAFAGDSWPGAELDIRDLRERVAKLDKEIAEVSADLMGANYV